MTGLTEAYVTAKLVTGVVLPLCVLATALVWVDPGLLVGAALALATTFGVVYAYARYVELDDDGLRSPAASRHPTTWRARREEDPDD
ncbi:hypothetical protein [Salinigranum salinum]|uniref:hypothetical protein n=1 Tax=Salinigranum salinum TaxID=1364937 RepID=UPI0012613663|nr:hypothetical protein [Salinigranum salinum]